MKKWCNYKRSPYRSGAWCPISQSQYKKAKKNMSVVDVFSLFLKWAIKVRNLYFYLKWSFSNFTLKKRKHFQDKKLVSKKVCFKYQFWPTSPLLMRLIFILEWQQKHLHFIQFNLRTPTIVYFKGADSLENLTRWMSLIFKLNKFCFTFWLILKQYCQAQAQPMHMWGLPED